MHINRNSFGGGLMAFVHNSLEFKIDNRFSGVTETHETLFFKLTCSGVINTSINFLCTYVPHRRYLHDFIKYLETFPKGIFRKNSVIIGDLNICSRRDINSREFKALENFAKTKNFSQLIQYPTYFSHQMNPSILDHVWSNLNVSSSSYVFSVPISDHIPSITSFSIPAKKPKEIQVFRDFSIHKKNIFHRDINNLKIELRSTLLNISDYNKKFDYLVSWYIKSCNNFFPIRKKVVSHKRFVSPWLTTPLINLINKKRELFAGLKRNTVAKATYSEYCKKLKKLLKICENAYHLNSFKKYRFDSRKKWNHINSILGRNVMNTIENIQIENNICSNKDEIANAFVDTFLEIPMELSSKMPQLSEEIKFEPPFNANTFFFKPVSPQEIEEIVMNLKNNSNISEIPMKFLKLTIPYISSLLAELFNECISVAKFPDCFKTAIVRAILKSGDKSLISNYRPISLLNVICKIFETLIFNRIYKFFDQCKLFSKNQFGFLKKRSTAQANLVLLHNSLPAIKNNEFTITVYLDLSKAFDCVNHSLLLKKLENYGVRGETLKFFQSYLTGRKQKVKIDDNHVSDTKNVTIGVPQGSCLGPLFYLIYCNDLNNIIEGVKIVNYADDIALVISGNNLTDMVHVMNNALEKISLWCIFNKLTINPMKSLGMIISNKKIPSKVELWLNGQLIKIVNSLKYLGIHLDNRLSFVNHLNYVNDRLSQICGISYKITYKFNLNTAKTYFFSFVYSLLSYGVTIWGGILMVYNCNRTFDLVRRIINNLFGWHYPKLSFEQITLKLRLLGPIDIYKLELMVLLYNIRNLSDYEHLSMIKFDRYDSGHNLRAGTELKVPFPRTRIIKTHHEYNMPLIWNSIPLEIREIDNSLKFKTTYKQYLLKEASKDVN